MRALFFVALLIASPAFANDDDAAGPYWLRERGQTILASKTSRLPNRSSVQQMVTSYAQRNGVPVSMAHGVIRIESRYNCRARNGGALGLGQIFRATARSVGVTGNLLDCATNLEASMKYLKLAIDLHGAGCAGASAYNRGVYAPSACTQYGRNVLARAREAM